MAYPLTKNTKTYNINDTFGLRVCQLTKVIYATVSAMSLNANGVILMMRFVNRILMKDDVLDNLISKSSYFSNSNDCR